jgi:hypothetical protein
MNSTRHAVILIEGLVILSSLIIWINNPSFSGSYFTSQVILSNNSISLVIPSASPSSSPSPSPTASPTLHPACWLRGSLTVTPFYENGQYGVDIKVCLYNAGLARTKDLQVFNIIQTKTDEADFSDYLTSQLDLSAKPMLDLGEGYCYETRIIFNPFEGRKYRDVVKVIVSNPSLSTGKMDSLALADPDTDPVALELTADFSLPLQPTATPTATGSISPSPTGTAASTSTAAPDVTPTPTAAWTETSTVSPTGTPSLPTAHPFFTDTPTPTEQPPLQTPTLEPSLAPTQTAIATETAVPTEIIAPTETPAPTEAPVPTDSPVPTEPEFNPSQTAVE